jgi:hypothetical protein
VEDNTQLDYISHPAAEGLGFVGDGGGRGIMLHSTLALRVERWQEDSPQVSVVGLYAQKPWVRQHEPRRRYEKKADRPQRARESQYWAEVLREVPPPTAGVRQTYVADRESDVYEVYQEFQSRPGRQYIVRACWARAQDGAKGSIFEAVGASPVLGRFSLDLRARPGAAARTARLEVRARTVTLRPPWRPGGKGPSCTVQGVEAREVDPPPDLPRFAPPRQHAEISIVSPELRRPNKRAIPEAPLEGLRDGLSLNYTRTTDPPDGDG